MILAVGNVKGGVGKTTLAVNIAIAQSRSGREVLLVDGDEQGTALAFTELRAGALKGTAGYTAVALQGTALRTQVRQLSPKYQDIIIDVGGRDNGSLRAALTVADTLLVPVQPRSFDIWALDQVATLVREAREINDTLRVVTALNAADAQGRDNAEAGTAMRDFADFEYYPNPIIRRKAFPNAAAAGMSVMEYNPRDSKAIDELARLIEHVRVNRSGSGAKYNGNRKESETISVR
jgi:chromosome partitioning protein